MRSLRREKQANERGKDKNPVRELEEAHPRCHRGMNWKEKGKY